MKLVPSTPGEVAFVVRTKLTSVDVPIHFAKFASVREEANALLREWDTESNPVVNMTIIYTFPVER